ncbi:MAG: bifunctional diaminohydroxyphosphoribosylaminopyrimidine deaminase/5-amino-6-(5-phosphoribosylamino)uracil reductase RibD [Rhodospirillales bacterium]|nr:bifunctional diaminohydroxyphosphoribosylaminopyrimidine deaminase/5-amino-6-(5-phosphoribosylamino)uracil reductase RibD [Rhodospirillales bacterium]
MTELTAAADSALDRRFMALALALAGRGLGIVWPNPAVGCVLVRDGVIVGRGWTQLGGRPHAETEALARAGEGTRGATCYTTLEPCAHHGETGPCADALVQAGIARAVVATQDPDPRVAGRGNALLEAAGIEVTVGCMEDSARALNAGFLSRVEKGRPLVTLKLASTLDGRIATHTGDSRWITGAQARARAHLLRACHDAVMVGAASALADDPALTCRLPGMEDTSPVRVVIDGGARLPAGHALIASAGEQPTWIVSTEALGRDGRHAEWGEAGVEVIEVAAEADGRPALAAALEALAGRGITRVLVEGGGRLAASLLGAGLVDRIEWFRAPGAIGGDGVPALAALGIDRADDMPRLVRIASTPVGEDVLDTLAPAS